MSRYRRAITGFTFFFTLVAYRQRPIFCDPAIRSSLHQAVRFMRATRQFGIDAWVVLPITCIASGPCEIE